MNDITGRSVAHALVAVLAAGLVLFLALLSYWHAASPEQDKSRFFPATEFRAVVSQARIRGDQLVVNGLMQADGNRRAVLSNWRGINTADYRFVAVGLEPHHPDLDVTLFWRPTGESEALHSQPLPGGGLTGTTFDMRLHPDWGGYVSEIGLQLTSKSGTFPVNFSGITLEPSGVSPTLLSLLNQWTAFRRVDQTTVNRLDATYSRNALSPVIVAAIWAALALLMLAALAMTGRPVTRFTYLATVLVIWLLLDLLWQRQLSAQLTLAQHLFQGKSLADRHAQDIDSDFYEHAMQLKQTALPAAPTRLFILHNSTGHNYQRLRMQYYLLPHNIYNYGLLPPIDALNPGDYLLVLDGVPGLNFDPNANVLTWGNGKALPVILRHSHLLGKLYEIGKSAPAQTSGAQGVSTQ